MRIYWCSYAATAAKPPAASSAYADDAVCLRARKIARSPLTLKRKEAFLMSYFIF